MKKALKRFKKGDIVAMDLGNGKTKTVELHSQVPDRKETVVYDFNYQVTYRVSNKTKGVLVDAPEW